MCQLLTHTPGYYILYFRCCKNCADNFVTVSFSSVLPLARGSTCDDYVVEMAPFPPFVFCCCFAFTVHTPPSPGNAPALPILFCDLFRLRDVLVELMYSCRLHPVGCNSVNRVSLVHSLRYLLHRYFVGVSHLLNPSATKH